MPWRLPAEWEPQESVWFVWPRDPDTWPGDHLAKARAAYRAAIDAVAKDQQVDLVVHPELGVPPGLAPQVRIHRVAHQDSWIRDYGPLTLIDDAGRRRHRRFRFDAWGGKYESLLMDDEVVGRLQEAGAFVDGVDQVGSVLEGGAVETDGQGTFLATASVARARGQTEEEHAAILREHLGARHVVWVEGYVPGDDTDGHIDTLARFVGPRRVVADPSAAASLRAADLDVIVLPPAPAIRTDDQEPLPAGYANFLITNRCVLVPQYGGAADAEAAGILRGCFPGRNIVPIDHKDLIWGYGGIHCLSMQVAAAQRA